MPEIKTGDITTSYEIHGSGYPLVLIHGGWVSQTMWSPQVEYFSPHFQLITYDVRGHGRTGGSGTGRYSIELFAEDLAGLLAALKIRKPVIAGLSMGGMIAQAYAVRYPDNLQALVLADTAASTELTAGDKITKYVIGPEWLFTGLVRLLGIKKYADFAFWYAARSRSSQWVGRDRSVVEYEKAEMLRFQVTEFNKIFSALYRFKLQELGKVKTGVLLINGEFESKSVLQHTRKMRELMPQAHSAVIPGAGHMSSRENPAAFNREIENFLAGLGINGGSGGSPSGPAAFPEG